jgi:hypothetical protein
MRFWRGTGWPASFDPLKSASEAGVLLFEHDGASQKLADPRLEGPKRIASLPQPGNREADGEQEPLAGAQ